MAKNKAPKKFTIKTGGTTSATASRKQSPARTPKPAKADRPSLAEQVEARLSEKCDVIHDLFVQADRNDVANRYEIARHCLDVRDNRRYGERAMPTLAERLGVSDPLVYNYAQVADVWSKHQFTKLAARRNKRGLPLSWSHIVELSREEDEIRREQLTAEALDMSWSVEKLAQVRKSDEAADEEPHVEQPGAAGEKNADQGAGIPAVTAAQDQLRKLHDRLADLPKTIAAVHPGDLPGAIDHLQKTSECTKELDEFIKHCIVQCEERLKLQSRKRKGK